MVLKADNIQVALFTRPGTPQPDALQVWNSACKDTSPDGFQRGNNTPMSVSSAYGRFRGYILNINSQLGRIDIFVSAVPDDGDNFPPAQIDHIAEALEVAGAVSSQTIHAAKPIRVALICSMAEYYGSMDEVVANLRTETGGIVFPGDSIDHIYQYNLQKLASDNVLMSLNRLVTYGSGVLQQLSGIFGLTGPNMSVSRELSALTLKLDINSLPSNDVTTVASKVLSNAISELNDIIKNGVRSIS